MKRAFVFLVVSPMAAALIAALTVFASGAPSDFSAFLAAAFFSFTLAVAAFAGTVDGVLARELPISLRSPLIAIVGAVGAYALAFYLFHCLFSPAILSLFAVGGAVFMGACSLLSHDYGGRAGAAVSSAI